MALCQPIYIKCSTAKAGVAGRHTQGPHLAVQVTISNLSGDTLKSLEFRGDPLQLCSATCKDERPSSGHAKVSTCATQYIDYGCVACTYSSYQLCTILLRRHSLCVLAGHLQWILTELLGASVATLREDCTVIFPAATL